MQAVEQNQILSRLVYPVNAYLLHDVQDSKVLRDGVFIIHVLVNVI